MGCTDCGGEPLDHSDRLVEARRTFIRKVRGVEYVMTKGEQHCIPFEHFALMTVFVKELGKCQMSSSEE